MGDAATAAELFAATLDINGDLPLIWVRLGDNLEANLDYEGAIQAYRSAIATSPDLLAPQLALAYLFFNRQQFDDAAIKDAVTSKKFQGIVLIREKF